MGKILDVADSLCIVFYCLVLFGIALYQSRKLKAQDDIFLAGRSMSRWPIAISMYMAVFSTNTFLGSTGWLSRPHGTIWIGVQSFGAMLAVPLVIELYPALYFRLRSNPPTSIWTAASIIPCAIWQPYFFWAPG